MLVEQVFSIEEYKYDTPWQAKARKHQSDFRELKMKVPAVPNTSRSGCYGNVISVEDGASGVNFYLPFRDEIMQDLNDKGRKSFLPMTYECLFKAMIKCGMDEIDDGWISYLTRRYIL